MRRASWVVRCPFRPLQAACQHFPEGARRTHRTTHDAGPLAIHDLQQPAMHPGISRHHASVRDSGILSFEIGDELRQPPVSGSFPHHLSHGARVSSQNPSSRPSATSVRSSAADPARRTPLVDGNIRARLFHIARRIIGCLEREKAGADEGEARIAERADTWSRCSPDHVPPPSQAVYRRCAGT